MDKKIIVFGEVLKRVSPVEGCCPFGLDKCTLVLKKCLDPVILKHCPYNGQNCQISFGGSEMNAGVSLKQMNGGFNVAMVTKLSDDFWGDAALQALKAYGIDTSFIKRGTEPLGEYLTEKVKGKLALKATYNRKNSVMAMAKREDFDFEEIFKDACWLHISGITPALSPTMNEISLEAVEYANKHNIPVSFDVNYREVLFQSLEEAQKVLQPFACRSDVLFVNEQEIKVLGFDMDGDELIYEHLFRGITHILREKYPRLKIIAHAQRKQLSENECQMQATYRWKDVISTSLLFKTKVVDPVGAGDAFAAALIATILWQKNDTTPETVKSLFKVDFATAASALKHTYHGDANLASFNEIADFVRNV